jgi:hypothetical protein
MNSLVNLISSSSFKRNETIYYIDETVWKLKLTKLTNENAPWHGLFYVCVLNIPQGR